MAPPPSPSPPANNDNDEDANDRSRAAAVTEASSTVPTRVASRKRRRPDTDSDQPKHPSEHAAVKVIDIDQQQQEQDEEQEEQGAVPGENNNQENDPETEEPSPKRAKKSLVTEQNAAAAAAAAVVDVVVEVAVPPPESAEQTTNAEEHRATTDPTRAAAAVEPTAPRGATTTLSNLRLPSHRTPGKHTDDHGPLPHWVGNVRRSLGTAKEPALSSTIPVPPPIATSVTTTTASSTTTTQRRLQWGGSTTTREPEPTPGEPIPKASSPAVQVPSPPSSPVPPPPPPAVRTDPTSPSSLWQYTSTWFILLLLLQVPFFSPILSTVVSASNVALEFYQSAAAVVGPDSSSSWLPLEAGAHNHGIALIVPQENVDDNEYDDKEYDEDEDEQEGDELVANPEPIIQYQTVIQTILTPNEERQTVLQELNDVQQQFDQAMHDFTRDIQHLEDEGRDVERMQWQLSRAMETALRQVDDQLHRLRHVLFPWEREDGTNHEETPVLTREPGAIRVTRDSLDPALRDYLLDLGFVQQWESLPNRTTCEDDGSPGSKASSLVSPSELHAYVEELVLDVTASAESVMKNDRIQQDVRMWVRDELMRRSAALLQEHTQVAPKIPDPAMADPTAAQGASLSQMESVIHNRLQLERADQTGRVDYASIMNGATVIKSGPMATSPSLKDNLPFLNRLAAHTNHAFYGYGPEMALTPKNPPLKLGQCWSFPPGGNVNAQWGMLSFRLARPVWVDVVSIEHPPPDVTDQSSSAIRHFRVLGWETPPTTPQQPRPWLLGSFEYQIDGAVRQEFSLPDTVEGMPVPRLHAMSLVIDSNWGMAAYSCLYRVRVLGRPDHDD